MSEINAFVLDAKYNRERHPGFVVLGRGLISTQLGLTTLPTLLVRADEVIE